MSNLNPLRNHLNNNPTGSQTLGRAPTPFPRAPPPALASPPATQPEPRRRAAQTAARAPADPAAQTAARATAPATQPRGGASGRGRAATQGPRARAAPVGTNTASAAKSLPTKTILFIETMMMALRAVLGEFFGPAAPQTVRGFYRPKNRRREEAPAANGAPAGDQRPATAAAFATHPEVLYTQYAGNPRRLHPTEPARDPNLPEGNTDETQYAEGEHPGQGPRHISRFVSAVAVGRNCKQHTGRKMNWSCTCSDVSCAANIGFTALGKVSDNTLWAWACAHQLVYLVAYCDGALRKAMRRGDPAIRKHHTLNACRYDHALGKHFCSDSRCGNAPSSAGPICDTYNRTTFRQRIVVLLGLCRGDRLRNLASEADVSEAGLCSIRQSFEEMLAGVQFYRNHQARGA